MERFHHQFHLHKMLPLVKFEKQPIDYIQFSDYTENL